LQLSFKHVHSPSFCRSELTAALTLTDSLLLAVLLPVD